MAVPQPLLLNANGSDFLLPQWNDTTGLITLSAGDTINLYCPNGIKDLNDTKNLAVTCIGDKIFQIGLEKQQLKNVRCLKHPWITLLPLPVNHTRNYCRNNSVADIGFRVADNRFLKTMSICHDPQGLRSFFSIYQLRPYNVAYQKGVGRLSFIESKEYNHTKTYSKFYNKDNQIQRVNQILGPDDEVDDYFDTDKLFFSRGHLGGKVDFFSANHQRSTFSYLNTAPQFQSINGGNWLRIEDGIRRYVAKKMFNATIISGTYGVLRFPSLADDKLYLARNRQLPVPQFFYKLIHDEDNSRGIVFVSINNPHIERDEIPDYLFCDNIIDQIKWVTLRDSLVQGYIFACDVNDFMEEMPVDLLPAMNVTSLLL